MDGWFRTRRPLLGDVTAAVAGLVLALLAMGLASLVGWRPWNASSYVFVAILSAVAWPLARLAPRATLLAVAMVVSWPTWWFFEDPELRLLPLVLVAFRCALAGVSPAFVAPVTALATVMTVIPSGWLYLWWYLSEFFGAGDYPLVVVDDLSRRLLTAVIGSVVLILGYLLRSQRSATAELRSKNAELIELRAADERRIEEEVRTAIARDIHDVVAHHVSAMVIRAQAADRVAETHPEQLRPAVQAVVADGREALAAMRRVVRVLRSGPRPDDADDDVPFAADVERIADRLREVGIRVDVAVDATGSPEFVQAALLRIIQEAMTNVMLHARATHVTVGVKPVDGGLRLAVTDDGQADPHAASRSRSGHGVPGMRERAQALQGTLSAAPRDAGGWAVEAFVPLGHQAVIAP